MTNFEILKDINFDNSYSHTIDFVSRVTQETFFDNLVELSFDDFTTVKENEEVKVPVGINDLQGMNYCRFTNTVKGKDKTFFAFILSKEYVNPETSRLKLEVDVFQTYMFDYELKESFVARQHKDRFTKTVENKLKPIFDNTKENLDYGSKYVLEKQEQMGGDSIELGGVNYPVLWYYITSSEPLGHIIAPSSTSKLDEIPTRQDNLSSNYYSYVIPFCINWNNQLNEFFINFDNTNRYLIGLTYLKELSEQSSIISIQVSNKPPFSYSFTSTVKNSGNEDLEFYSIELSNIDFSFKNALKTLDQNTTPSVKCFIQLVRVETLETTIYEETFVDMDLISFNNIATKEYEPKLLTDPYRFAKIKSGDVEKIIQLEDFLDYNIIFSKIKSVTTKGTSMIIPKNYKNMETNFIEALINIDENNVAIRTDAWKQYEATNKANLRSGLLVNAGGNAFNSLLSAGIGLATGNPFAIAGAVTSGVSIGTGIANEMLKREDIKKSPDTLQSTGDDIMLKYNLTGLQDFILFYEITDDFKQRLFKYFQYFGYASNTIEVPNLLSRYYYNYIKTIGTTIVANLDNEIIQKLKTIFENGVTIWHYRDPLTFKGMLNYNFENVEMSIHSTQGE